MRVITVALLATWHPARQASARRSEGTAERLDRGSGRVSRHSSGGAKLQRREHLDDDRHGDHQQPRERRELVQNSSSTMTLPATQRPSPTVNAMSVARLDPSPAARPRPGRRHSAAARQRGRRTDRRGQPEELVERATRRQHPEPQAAVATALTWRMRFDVIVLPPLKNHVREEDRALDRGGAITSEVMGTVMPVGVA